MIRKEDFKLAMNFYRDRHGFPAGQLGALDSSGNCLMFLGEEMIIASDLGLEKEDLERFERLLRLCTLEPGNFARTPHGNAFATDQEGWDDYIGITAAAAVMRRAAPMTSSQLIAAVILFGRRHLFRWGIFTFPYCYPTTSPAPEEWRDVRAWFGRYLQFVAHLRWCADEKPNWIQRLVWCWSVAFAGLRDPHGQDPWRLSYLLVRAQRTRRRPWQLEALAEAIWRFRLIRIWPGGLRAVRARYFNDGNHPLAVFADSEKG